MAKRKTTKKRLYVLLKRKGSKQWLGAIPTKAGVSRQQAQKAIRKNLKSGFVAKIVNASQLQKLLRSATKKSSSKRRISTKKRKRRATPKQLRALAKARRAKKRR